MLKSLLQNIEFYVIHLKRCNDRAINVSKIQNRFPNSHIFEATDSRDLDDKKLDFFKSAGYLPQDITYDSLYSRLVSKQNIAIYLSHVLLWENIVTSSGADYILVFEDDAILSDEFKFLFFKYSEIIIQYEITHLYVFPEQVKKYNFRKGEYQKTPEGLWGLQCYVIKREIIDTLLSKIKPFKTTIDEHFTRSHFDSITIYDNFITHGIIESQNLNY